MKQNDKPYQLTITVAELEFLALVDQAEKQLAESGVRMTWPLLAILEPELGELRSDVRAVHDDGEGETFCANRCWYLDIKPRLLELVGWERPIFHPVLSTAQAYNLAYRQLYDLLPPCRHRSAICL